jgi:hypothetical protein
MQAKRFLIEDKLIFEAGNLEVDVARQGARVNPMGGDGNGLRLVHI